MQIQKWLIPGLLCLAVGCIGPAHRPKVSQVPAPPEHVQSRNYEPDAPRTALPGEAMVRVKDYWVQGYATSSYVLDQAVTVQTRKRMLTLPHGAVLLSRGGIMIQGKRYLIYHNANDDSDYGVVYYFNPDMTMARFLYMRDGSSFSAGMEAITKVYPETFRLPQTPAPAVLQDRAHLDYEMVFKGLGPDGLRLTYREFRPGEATPSFQEDLTFPADARQISYKDIQIKLQACTEKQIDFTVASD